MRFMIIGKNKVIIALIAWFFIRVNMPVYAQMPKGPESDLLEKFLAEEAGSAKDVQREEAVSAAEEPAESVMKIKRLDDQNQVYSFELKDAQIKDIFRVLAYDYKLNLLVDNEVEGKITATMTNVSLGQFLDAIAESLNLIIEKNGNFIKVKPNLITKTFVLKYIEAQNVLLSSKSGENTIYDFLSAKGKIFLGRQPNSIIVVDYPPNINKLEDYLKEIDRRMSSQVFKLKYLKASDIVGVENDTQSGVASSASEGSETYSLPESSTITGG